MRTSHSHHTFGRFLARTSIRWLAQTKLNHRIHIHNQSWTLWVCVALRWFFVLLFIQDVSAYMIWTVARVAIANKLSRAIWRGGEITSSIAFDLCQTTTMFLRVARQTLSLFCWDRGSPLYQCPLLITYFVRHRRRIQRVRHRRDAGWHSFWVAWSFSW